MMNKLLVLDADSTLFNEEAIDLLAALAGVQNQVSSITEAAMRGELDFAESLTQRVGLLKDSPANLIDAARNQLTLTEGAIELISAARQRNCEVAIVSGGFVEIIEPLLISLGIHKYRANQLEIQDGVLSGNLVGAIVDRSAKANILKEFARELNLDLIDTIAVGDGANDIEMIETAGIGIAFCAKSALTKVADVSINTRDLKLVIDYI